MKTCKYCKEEMIEGLNKLALFKTEFKEDIKKYYLDMIDNPEVSIVNSYICPNCGYTEFFTILK